MSWDSVPWFIGGGAEHSPEVARLLAYASTAGAEGIVGTSDLRVAPLSVPGGSIRVAPGAALIRNRAAGGASQTYVARNPTEDVVAIAATGSAGGRSDLIVAQVEDPNMAGEPWQTPTNPAVGPYIFTRVIPNVPAGTTSLRPLSGYSGRSAIVLARVDLPASTGTVTASMITDLRELALPRNDRRLDVSQAATLTLESNTIDTLFPPNQAEIYIPSWANRLKAVATVHGISALNAGPTAEHKLRLGRSNFVYGYPTFLDIDQAAGAAQRISLAVGLDIPVPAALRGTTQPLVLLGRRTNASAGRFRVNSGAHVIYDVDLRRGKRLTAWRYVVQRALTNHILELELPLDRDELTWDLSGPGTLRGTLAPEIGQLRAADGRLLLEEWGTLIYAEADGEIRWGGIVVSSKFAGEKWTVEAAGFTTYPTGIPFTASYSGVKVDPAAVVRMLWAHVQSFPDANLGVTVVGETPVRLGSDSEVYLANAVAAVKEETARVASEEAKLDAARKQLTDARKAQTDATKARTAARKIVTERKSALTAAKKTKDPAKISAAQSALDAANRAFAAADARVTSAKATVTTRSAAVTAQTAVVKDRRGDLKDAKDAETENKEKVSADGGAYKLRWWEAPDVGAEIDTLAKETPFDYVERHSWSGESIRHEVQLAYPRLGRRREDLAFVQGDNIVSLVEPDLDGADFANEVLGLGAGEGEGALRRTTAVRDGRLRRVAVHSAKSVASASRLDAQIRDALIQHCLGLQINSVTVRDHPNAPIGSWSLGDDVLIEASLPWLGDIAVWHRITGWTLTSDHTATLQLARSDSFIYGG